jgi:hypothetical protein
VALDPAAAQLGVSAGQKLTHAAPSFWLLAAGKYRHRRQETAEWQWHLVRVRDFEGDFEVDGHRDRIRPRPE